MERTEAKARHALPEHSRSVGAVVGRRGGSGPREGEMPAPSHSAVLAIHAFAISSPYRSASCSVAADHCGNGEGSVSSEAVSLSGQIETAVRHPEPLRKDDTVTRYP